MSAPPAVQNVQGTINAAAMGFLGNGTFDDTELLIDLGKQAFDSGCELFVPSGIKYLHHPVSFKGDIQFRCAPGFQNGNGTVWRPSKDFDLTYNENGARSALFQCLLSSDPTTKNRWQFYPSYYSHGLQLENVYVENVIGVDDNGQPLPGPDGLDGIVIYQPADSSHLWNCRATGFQTGFHIYGMCGPLTTYGCTAFGNNDYAWRFESLHDVFSENAAGGDINMFGGGGDNNSPGWIYAAGTHRGLVSGLKLEYVRKYTDTILMIEASKESIGTGKPDRSRWTLQSVGCEFYAGLVKSAPWVEALVKVQHTETDVATEFPLPVVKISGGQFWGGIESILWDKGFNRRFNLSKSGKGEPGTDFVYAAGGVEKTTCYVQGGHQFLGGPTQLQRFTLATLPDPALWPDTFAFLVTNAGLKSIAIPPAVVPTAIPVHCDGVHWWTVGGNVLVK